MNNMKKVTGFLLAHLLYYTGDFTSKVMNFINLDPVYQFYNWCMVKSTEVQDWAELKSPWKDITTKNK